MKKRRIFSGMRPTGKLHVGHLIGALQNWVVLQGEYECFYGIVDWHALAGGGYRNTDEIRGNIRQMAIDWISVGIDPNVSTLLVQSHVKEHAELHLLLSMITPTPWLIRNPTVKEQARDLGLIASEDDVTSIEYGYLGYPVLQAADILVYKADTVPVGDDQVPHIEMAREIARRFNSLFGEVFPEPQAKLTQTPRLLGVDGKKMSKSLDNCIYISEKPEDILRKVMVMITDPARVKREDKGHPEVCSVFGYHKVFNEAETPQIAEDCRNARIGCVECKRNLARKIADLLAPYREKRAELECNPERIDEILRDGESRARAIAQETMREVRHAMKLE
ncbi:MAG: tryptophan--tRNA ligase [bacterium]